ncbi:MAG TPA: hypothetical protein VIX60_04670 [Candidatus Cybelea sp.]
MHRGFAFLGAALILLVVIFARLVSSISSIYSFGHLLNIVAIGLFSLLMGWLFGGPDRQYRRTLSIATLMKNISLCTLIGTSPEFDPQVVHAL